ncbi:M3 family metallopeptidase [Propionibacterium sp.]|uniref:M3 family metallopeptidase n=1 Tax=Propionibacterium sp. TaxID=1977903 RepID=UPI0039E7512E
MTESLPEQSEFHLPEYAVLNPDVFGRLVRQEIANEQSMLDTVAADSSEPTEETVIRPWEEAGVYLSRVTAAMYTQRSADTTPELDAVCDELAPELAAHADSILLDPQLYARLTALEAAEKSDAAELDEQASWWLSESLRDFRRHGVQLGEADQKRLREINSRIASLESQFSQMIVGGRNDAAVLITDGAELEGLSDEQKQQTAEAAQARGEKGWLLELVNTTGQDWLASLDNQDTRRKVFEASIGRGGAGMPHDTGALVVELARLRAERATLLGFESHAALVASAGCAKTVDALQPLLDRFSQLALGQARADATRYADQFAKLAPGLEFQPWDWAWTATKLKAAEAVDDEELRPYLEFDRVMKEGVFAAAEQLYGITFVPRRHLAGYTPDTQIFEVDEPNGITLGLVMVDAWTRPSKQGGAWMTDLVNQDNMYGDLPVVTFNTNFVKPREGQPTLLSWDQVITCFHEFGHCLHGLLSDVRYPSMSGTNTPTDYVEFPSQVNEHWASDPALVARYARHWKTGEPLPQETIDKMERARLSDIGFDDLELAAAMQLDQAWHATPIDQLPTDASQVDDFEAAALKARGVACELVPPRYRTRYFSHIWATGYDANYYAYLWAEVFDADTCAWFDEHGGLNREAGEHFRREVLAVGGSVDVMKAYQKFRGADPDVEHLIARHTRS